LLVKITLALGRLFLISDVKRKKVLSLLAC
jgi:hypothetical protein